LQFYVSDDLKDDLEQYKKDPNAQYVWKWCDAWEVDRVNGDSEKCPVCGRHVSMLRWLEPRKLRLTSTKYPDRLTAWLSDMVVSERFKNAYEQEGLTGIREFTPVEVVKVARMKVNSPNPPKYFCAEVDYTRNVRVDVKKSKIKGQKTDWKCPLCNPWGSTRDKILKLVLNTSDWQGEDIFKVYSFRVVVSQRFYDVIQRYDFTNFNMVPVEEYILR
jgi:rubrerythrin